ncbi:MAG TPA: MBL fold metallo-hydrolase [Jatrophihabitans sp.]|jgi:glyoxylase-like metal-dependent hydrolase (beta-lactamase superfamily II)|uniref:MBL fold metallo-hydrolase n=1 Tax=Jatrophihabitans sp. TaxID=1932789 RepID=UPI002F2476C1
MTYTGEVSVGGEVDTRELTGLSIAKLAVGPMSNNAYLLRCRASGQALLIDAAAEPGRLLDLVRLGGETASAVLTTHKHPDHWQALAGVVAQTGARTMAGADDARGIPVPTDRRLEHGDTVHVGDAELRVIVLRGHTPCSVALYYRDPDGSQHLFTGDSLFPGGPGKTGSPKDFNSLMDDLERRVFDAYDDEVWFYPGHGNDSTLGAERPHLAEWRARGW